MKFFKFLNVLVICILFGACSEDLSIQDKFQPDEKVENSKFIPIEEALLHADELFSKIGDNTRSSMRNVISVECVKSLQTRSEADNDTLYYIVNYQNEEGFAVLSANRDLGYVYAISDEGHLSFEDTVTNKGVAQFFNRLNTYISNPTPTPNPNDSLLKPSPIDSTLINPAKFPVEELMSPLLPKNLQRWPGKPGSEMSNRHQSVEAAVGMILAYFEKPVIWESFMDHTVTASLDYKLIKSYNLWANSVKVTDKGFKEIDKFLTLVKESFFEIDRRYDYEKDCEYELLWFPNCAKQFGDHFGYHVKQLYSEPGSLGHEHQEPMSVDSKEWKDALKDGNLILIGNFIENFGNEKPLHLWVADGYVTFKKNRNTYLNKYGADTLFHCVWAMGGACNGYYAFQSDGTEFIHTPISLDTSLPGTVPSDIPYIYYYGFKPK